MRRFFQQLSRFAHSRTGKIFCLVIVLAGVLLVARPVFADGVAATLAADGANWIIRGVTHIALGVARIFLGLTIAFLRIFIQLAAYNDYIDSPPVIVGWYMVRDVANMFFVVALLGIAFGTMLGLEQYEWKKSLVKLVGAAILINFSRLIIGVAIDAANVFTITFLDAVQGTAGGNLIGMLHLDKIFNLATGGLPSNDDLRTDLFGASVMAVFFSLIAMLTIGAYLVVMAIRIVVLWVLIIISPIAFVLSSIPQTKSYADDFWGELSKHIIVAPVMVFFLWLAFATLGNGQINNHVGVKTGGIGAEETQQTLGLPNGSSGSVSILEISTWENLSGFVIAIVFLLIGLDRVNKVGATGSSFVSGVADFAKKGIMVASGYALGRWGAGKVGQGASAVVGALGKGALAVGDAVFDVSGKANRTKNWVKQQAADFQATYMYWTPFKLGKVHQRKEKDDTEDPLQEQFDAAGVRIEDADGRAILKDKEGRQWREKMIDEKVTDPLTGKETIVPKKVLESFVKAYDKESGTVKEVWKEQGEEYLENREGATFLQRRLKKRAVKNAASDKMLEKTENFLQIKKDIMGSLTQGVPQGMFSDRLSKDETDDAVDRRYQGILAQLKSRSAAKTEEYSQLGEILAAELPRFQYVTKMDEGGETKDKKNVITNDGIEQRRAKKYELVQGTVGKTGPQMAEVMRHKLNAAKYQARKEKLTGEFKMEVVNKQEEEARKVGAASVVSQTVAATRAAHSAGVKYDELTKRRDADFLRTDEGKHELAEDAELKRKIAREEGTAKSLEKIADRDYIRSATGAQVLRETKGEQVKEAGAAASVTTVETEAQKLAMTDQDAAVREAEWEKVNAELEKAAVAEFETTAKNRYVKGRKGRAKLFETEKAKQRTKVMTTEIEAAQSNAAKLAFEDLPASLVTKLNLAEQAKVAADEFLKKMKNKDLTVGFTKAAEKMRKIIAAGGKDLEKNMNAAAEKSAYVRVLQQQTLGKKDQEAAKLAQDTATENAKAGFWEIPKLGKATPSTALGSLTDQAGKDLSTLEAPAGAAMAASWIAHILKQKTKSGGIDQHQQATLFGAIAHITKEAWNDDTIAEIAALFKDLDEGKLDVAGKEGEKEDVIEMKRIFEGELGLIKKDAATGNYKAFSSPKDAAALQNLVAMGGNMKMVKSHQQVEDRIVEINKEKRDIVNQVRESYTNTGRNRGMSEAEIEEEITKALKDIDKQVINIGGIDFELGAKYGDVAKALDTNLSVGSFDEFQRELEKNQEFLQDASSTFKRAALSVGHLQMGGNQGYDREMGMYRMFTRNEATNWITTEASKRKGLENSQYHSLGKIDLTNGRLVEILDNYYKAIFSGVTSTLNSRNVNARTRDQVTGYATNQAKDSYNETSVNSDGKTVTKEYLLIGGDNANIKAAFKTEKDFLANFLLPQLRSQAEAFKLISREKGEHVGKVQSENGLARLAIDMGNGRIIKGERFSEFIEAVRTELVTNQGLVLSDEDERLLRNAINTSKAKESNLKNQDLNGAEEDPDATGGAGP